MPSISARSYAMKAMEPVPRFAARSMASCNSGLSLRARAITRYPAFAKQRTMPSPMPRLPPVTMTLRMPAYQLSCVRDG